jgi:hypothetical protein
MCAQPEREILFDTRFTDLAPFSSKGAAACALGVSEVGDVTTLANPEVVEQIRHAVQSEKSARGEAPRELSEQEQREIGAFGNVE